MRYMYMNDFSPFFYGPHTGFFGIVFPLIILVALWTVILKGFALWHAARAGQKWWFIALLVINTIGILELVYLLFFRPNAPYKRAGDKTTETVSSVVQ